MDDLRRRAELMPGLEQIHAWVINSDRSAREFYLKHGFESKGVVHDYLKIDGKYVDCEYLVLYFSDRSERREDSAAGCEAVRSQ